MSVDGCHSRLTPDRSRSKGKMKRSVRSARSNGGRRAGGEGGCSARSGDFSGKRRPAGEHKGSGRKAGSVRERSSFRPRGQRRRRPWGSRNNLILIGMPGSGKSTLGRAVANLLKLPFVDTDKVLYQQTGKTTGQLTASLSNEGFMEAETRAVCAVRPKKQIVIATGGSVVYSERAMKHLRRLGLLVYLDVPLAVLRRRLGDLHKRGVVLKPGQDLADLYRERDQLYRKYAEVTFSAGYYGKRETAAALAHFYSFMAEPFTKRD